MSLQLLLARLQGPGDINLRPVVLQLVHETCAEFVRTSNAADQDRAALAEMVHKLEDRVDQKLVAFEERRAQEIAALRDLLPPKP